MSVFGHVVTVIFYNVILAVIYFQSHPPQNTPMHCYTTPTTSHSCSYSSIFSLSLLHTCTYSTFTLGFRALQKALEVDVTVSVTKGPNGETFVIVNAKETSGETVPAEDLEK